MDILLESSLGDQMPVELYKMLNFEAGGLRKQDWLALSHKTFDNHMEKWRDIFHEFEYIGNDGSYFLCLDAQNNLCLAKEREIEKLEITRL